MKFILTLLIFLLPTVSMAQKSVTEYTDAQRTALQEFIDRNPSYQFIPETLFDEDTLKTAKNEWGFGKNFKPYYQVGDFNGDGRRDFAVILLTGKNTEDPNSGMHVVVFNRVRGNKYQKVHVEHEEFSTALFINTKKNKLFVGVMETDSAGCFVPTKRGYIVEPCGGVDE